MSVELVLLVHPEHELAKRKRVQVADLAPIRYIAQSASSATCRHLERALGEAGLVLKPSRLVEDATARILMVELGIGETFVPTREAARIERAHGVKAVRVSSLPPLQMGWVARKFALLPEVAQQFLQVCDELGRGH